MENIRIAIADDNEESLDLLKFHLQAKKARVFPFRYGMEAIRFMEENQVDLLICDQMLKDLNGLEICRWVKGNKDLTKVPFVMLSERGEEEEIVTAFESGADEYMVKPIRMRELLARIKNILGRRRATPAILHFQSPSPDNEEPQMQYHAINMNPQNYTVNIEGAQVDLTLTEFNLLQMLISRPGQVYSRNQIIEKLKGLDYNATERAVDVQVVGLRKKIGKYRTYLETVRGVGYRMRSYQKN